jgi:hypothetical protein
MVLKPIQEVTKFPEFVENDLDCSRLSE